MFREQGVHRVSHRSLRHGDSRALRVGTVAHESQHPFFPDLREPLQIDTVSVYRRIIHFEVSRVHYRAGRRIDGQRGRVGDTVICLDKFHTELPQIDGLTVFYHLAFGGFQHVVFL